MTSLAPKLAPKLAHRLAIQIAIVASILPAAAYAVVESSLDGINYELGQRGKPEAPGAPIACMDAVKAKLPNPEAFRWTRSTTRRVAEDAYSVVGNIEFKTASGESRKGDAQCDVMRAPGNNYIVPKVRLP
ncbi:DUF2880 domain-containing protein [Cupriavidus plantarum]|uniref:DUF2880 domain-containing protein n=1 Tax=Cupriavidus plantarum TaxID=942865 RepID=UPI000E27D034|nr:DUF2880 domain-containing protein [Cupriavidus plantarum]REE91039.1 uncharacterized protein DUF2880 [Cupriavidus plantarum]